MPHRADTALAGVADRPSLLSLARYTHLPACLIPALLTCWPEPFHVSFGSSGMGSPTQTPHGRTKGDRPIPPVNGVAFPRQREPGKRMRSWVGWRCIQHWLTPPWPDQSPPRLVRGLSSRRVPVLGTPFGSLCTWSAPRAGVSLQLWRWPAPPPPYPSGGALLGED